jgi:hypothetical protein
MQKNFIGIDIGKTNLRVDASPELARNKTWGRFRDHGASQPGFLSASMGILFFSGSYSTKRCTLLER